MKRHKMIGRFNVAASIGLTTGLLTGATTIAQAQDTPPFYSTTPILEARHFRLNMSPGRALDRAREALKAANLHLLDRTAISDGGTSRYLYVIIHCKPSEGGTIGDVSIASYPGHDAERRKTIAFLYDYMVNGRNPNGANGWAGTWRFQLLDGRWVTLSLNVQGDRVTGSYAFRGGRVEGNVVNGNTVRGTFTNDADTGPFEWVLQPDGRRFTGHYYSNALKKRFAWNAERN